MEVLVGGKSVHSVCEDVADTVWVVVTVMFCWVTFVSVVVTVTSCVVVFVAVLVTCSDTVTVCDTVILVVTVGCIKVVVTVSGIVAPS